MLGKSIRLIFRATIVVQKDKNGGTVKARAIIVNQELLTTM